MPRSTLGFVKKKEYVRQLSLNNGDLISKPIGFGFSYGVLPHGETPMSFW